MSQTRHTDSWIAFHVFHMWCFRVGLIFLQTLVKFLDVHQPQAGTIWLQRSSGGWKSLNAYLIRCLRRGWALKQISGVFFRLETRLLDAATDPFGFFFFNFSWGCSLDGVFCLSIMPLCIVLALPQMILIISWLLGKKCGPVDSQFPIFHWFEWLFIGPVWEAQHSLFRRTYSLVKFFQPFWKIQGSRCYLHGRSFWHDHYIWLCCCIDCFASLWLSRGSKYQGSYR